MVEAIHVPRLREQREMKALAALALALVAPPAFAAKTDVVILKNGDRVTCEIRELSRGKLQVKTDDIGTLDMEWDKIASVSATAPFDVEDLAGKRYLGSLTPGAPGQVSIRWRDNEATVDLLSIVRIRRLYTSFWERLDGSLDAGASYASASELFTLDLSGSVGVERPGWEVDLSGNATFSTQPDVENTQRANLSITYERRFEDRWFALAQGKLEQNRELGFDLRSSTTAGGGRYLVQTRRDRLLAGVGMSLNREKPVDGESTTNLEAAAFLSYDRFSYDFPKVDVTLSLGAFTGLSDSSRQRLEFEASLKRELVRDFYATLRGYESYDSEPATEGAPTDDYGVTFALGWSF
jgi:ribosomal protein L34